MRIFGKKNSITKSQCGPRTIHRTLFKHLHSYERKFVIQVFIIGNKYQDI